MTVSDADGGCVPQQIRDVEKFLDRNAQIIVAVKQSVAGCTSVMDLAWDFPRSSIGQYNRFPSGLLAKLAELQMDLEISVYGKD
ncbi:MAG: hypothetical protein NXI04_28105 [Planctomycetaceae bacterium]|nr:hypothetical protein [Planctomycetaceae bacterium]